MAPSSIRQSAANCKSFLGRSRQDLTTETRRHTENGIQGTARLAPRAMPPRATPIPILPFPIRVSVSPCLGGETCLELGPGRELPALGLRDDLLGNGARHFLVVA